MRGQSMRPFTMNDILVAKREIYVFGGNWNRCSGILNWGCMQFRVRPERGEIKAKLSPGSPKNVESDRLSNETMMKSSRLDRELDHWGRGGNSEGASDGTNSSDKGADGGKSNIAVCSPARMRYGCSIWDLSGVLDSLVNFGNVYHVRSAFPGSVAGTLQSVIYLDINGKITQLPSREQMEFPTEHRSYMGIKPHVVGLAEANTVEIKDS
ncbi:hypothetical protein B0H13DRAFT_2568787 [Mycena leptocephala]|nr:hypothetical protein B0H13DRAFT_2568787 [Mycena leptocephala]